jgi:hypothetical protein
MKNTFNLKTLIYIIPIIMIVSLFSSFTNSNDSSVNTKTSHELLDMNSDSEGEYCSGFYSGYQDGYKEQCGVSGGSEPCQGDYMNCPSMTPYKCGWTQGYKKGSRDGRARCK